MSHIENRRGKYRARYADPLGVIRSRTFTRKADAERSLREIDADMLRGRWVEPSDADIAFETWAQEFLQLSRRLARLTQETYARDLNQCVIPRFGTYRLGHLPAEEIENWLNDESRLRHRRVVRPPSLPEAASRAAAVEKQKIIATPCDRNRGGAKWSALSAPRRSDSMGGSERCHESDVLSLLSDPPGIDELDQLRCLTGAEFSRMVEKLAVELDTGRVGSRPRRA